MVDNPSFDGYLGLLALSQPVQADPQHLADPRRKESNDHFVEDIDVSQKVFTGLESGEFALDYLVT